MKIPPNHQPATLGDVRAHVPTLTQLLATVEFPCTSDCRNGWIDNGPAVHAWETENAEALEAFRADRRARHSAMVGPEESALRETEPPWMLPCPCCGTGYVLTDEGHALVGFVRRHLAGGDDDV